MPTRQRKGGYQTDLYQEHGQSISSTVAVYANPVMNFVELSDWLFNLRISNAVALLLFCVLSIAGLMYILSQLTKGIPKRLLIVVPIPLYLLTGLIAAIVYVYRN
jgi:hypothetical protein